MHLHIDQPTALAIMADLTDGLPQHVRAAFIRYAVASGLHGHESPEATRLLETFGVLIEAGHEQVQCISLAAFIRRVDAVKRAWGIA